MPVIRTRTRMNCVLRYETRSKRVKIGSYLIIDLICKPSLITLRIVSAESNQIRKNFIKNNQSRLTAAKPRV
jgi:hypothetical protein